MTHCYYKHDKLYCDIGGEALNMKRVIVHCLFASTICFLIFGVERESLTIPRRYIESSTIAMNA